MSDQKVFGGHFTSAARRAVSKLQAALDALNDGEELKRPTHPSQIHNWQPSSVIAIVPTNGWLECLPVTQISSDLKQIEKHCQSTRSARPTRTRAFYFIPLSSAKVRDNSCLWGYSLGYAVGKRTNSAGLVKRGSDRCS